MAQDSAKLMGIQTALDTGTGQQGTRDLSQANQNQQAFTGHGISAGTMTKNHCASAWITLMGKMPARAAGLHGKPVQG